MSETRVERRQRGQRVTIGPSAGQSPESVARDFERSFTLGDRMLANGTQAWTSHYRRVGPVRFMAYKEVGPPPWKWPKVGVQPWRGRTHPCVRFIVGWRSTAYALVVMWHPTDRALPSAAAGDQPERTE